jgi:hypothetical protein
MKMESFSSSFLKDVGTRKSQSLLTIPFVVVYKSGPNERGARATFARCPAVNGRSINRWNHHD